MNLILYYIILFIAGNAIGFLIAGMYYDDERWIVSSLIEVLICTLLLFIFVIQKWINS